MEQAVWEELSCRGEAPKNLSHFSMFVYQSKIFAFGIQNQRQAQQQDKRSKKSEIDVLSFSKTPSVMFYVLNL